MAEKLSTGLANQINLLAIKAVMDGGTIHIYGGAAQPATADLAETGTLLAKLTKDGLPHTPGSATNGIVMGTSTDGVLSANGDTISGIGLAAAGTGVTATWYRWYDKDVVTGASTTAKRFDGAIGTSSSFEGQMANTTVVEGEPLTINTFTHTTKRS